MLESRVLKKLASAENVQINPYRQQVTDLHLHMTEPQKLEISWQCIV
jgi:hypothetical protein